MEIYVGYAYSSDSGLKYQANKKACEELKSKYKVLSVEKEPTEEEMQEYDFIYKFERSDRQYKDVYRVFKEPEELKTDEALCLITGGSMPFGGCKSCSDNYVVYID